MRQLRAVLRLSRLCVLLALDGIVLYGALWDTVSQSIRHYTFRDVIKSLDYKVRGSEKESSVSPKPLQYVVDTLMRRADKIQVRSNARRSKFDEIWQGKAVSHALIGFRWTIGFRGLAGFAVISFKHKPVQIAHFENDPMISIYLHLNCALPLNSLLNGLAA